MGRKALEAEAAIKALPRGKFSLHWPVPGEHKINHKQGQDDPTGNGYFGWTRKLADGASKKHDGFDISAEVGAPVSASALGGVTILPLDPSGYGSQVIVDHGNGFFTQYGHLGGQLVEWPFAGDKNKKEWVLVFSAMSGRPRQPRTGDLVGVGDQIGVVGRSGNVPEKAQSHVPFEVRFGNDGQSKNTRTVVNPRYSLPLD